MCLFWFNFGIRGYSVESKDYFQFCAQGSLLMNKGMCGAGIQSRPRGSFAYAQRVEMSLPRRIHLETWELDLVLIWDLGSQW